jgi:hypothetical protein
MENNKVMTCLSTLNTETMTPGIMKKLTRTYEYYDGLLMLLVLEVIKNFHSGAKISPQNL